MSYYFGATSDRETFMKLKSFFIETLGASDMFDLSYFNEVALELSYNEFEQRFLKSAKYDPEKMSQIKKSLSWNR